MSRPTIAKYLFCQFYLVFVFVYIAGIHILVLLLLWNRSFWRSYTSRKVTTTNHGHLPSPSYRIFIPDHAGFFPFYRKRAARKHYVSCKLQLCKKHTQLLRICIAHTWLVVPDYVHVAKWWTWSPYRLDLIGLHYDCSTWMHSQYM